LSGAARPRGPGAGWARRLLLLGASAAALLVVALWLRRDAAPHADSARAVAPSAGLAKRQAPRADVRPASLLRTASPAGVTAPGASLPLARALLPAEARSPWLQAVLRWQGSAHEVLATCLPPGALPEAQPVCLTLEHQPSEGDAGVQRYTISDVVPELEVTDAVRACLGQLTGSALQVELDETIAFAAPLRMLERTSLTFAGQ
jgi:hypothetical protein